MTRLLGLKPHTPQKTDISLSDVYDAHEALPANFGTTGLDWGMLGNDTFGNCYWASSAHEVMAQAKSVGRQPKFTATSVLTSYARYLGLKSLDELNEKTDQGTDARAGAKFRRKYGVEDARGHGDKIGAYTFIEEPDYDLIKSAVYDFGGVTVCVNLPESAEEAFSEAEGTGSREIVWDYVEDSEIVGGHAISGVSVRGGTLTVISWGREVQMTEAFVQKYLQCVVVYITGADLNSEGVSTHGLNREALRKHLAEVTTDSVKAS